jgi:hypothetical protein
MDIIGKHAGVRLLGKRLVLALFALVGTSILVPEVTFAQDFGAIIGALGGFRGGGGGGGFSRHSRHHASHSSHASRHRETVSSEPVAEARAPTKSSGQGPDFTPSR